MFLSDTKSLVMVPMLLPSLFKRRALVFVPLLVSLVTLSLLYRLYRPTLSSFAHSPLRTFATTSTPALSPADMSKAYVSSSKDRKSVV